jgi:hypothetical protein
LQHVLTISALGSNPILDPALGIYEFKTERKSKPPLRFIALNMLSSIPHAQELVNVKSS